MVVVVYGGGLFDPNINMVWIQNDEVRTDDHHVAFHKFPGAKQPCALLGGGAGGGGGFGAMPP